MDGTVSGSDPFAEWVLDMIQASETMTDAELDWALAEADPATAEVEIRGSDDQPDLQFVLEYRNSPPSVSRNG